MFDNQYKLITFIFLIIISSVRCKNIQFTLDDSNDWNNVANEDLISNRLLLPKINRQNYKTKSDLLNQFLNNDMNSLFNLNEDKKQLFNYENDDAYGNKLNGLKNENLFDLNNIEQISPFYLRLLSNLKPSIESDEFKNFRNSMNRPFTETSGDIMNRKTRSNRSNKQRSYAEYNPNLMNFFNRDLIQSRSFKNENSQEKQSGEIIEMLNSKPKKADELNENSNKNKNTKSINKENRSTKQLLTNRSNNSPSLLASQSLTKSSSTSSNSIINPSSPKKNKWINRVSKSTSFRGNNVSDCIKNCVNQGILHPVQCHSLC